MRYQVVRIDNGIENPHTGIVKNGFDTVEAAQEYIDKRNQELRKRAGQATCWYPYAILDTQTGAKR